MSSFCWWLPARARPGGTAAEKVSQGRRKRLALATSPPFAGRKGSMGTMSVAYQGCTVVANSR
jgi:hypothetical protein